MKPFCIAAFFSVVAAAATATPAHAQRLAAPTPAPTPIPLTKTSAKQAEPLTGFQDIKWGDSIAKATKVLQSKGATVEKAVGSDNTLRVSNLKVAGYDTQFVSLRFGNEGFYQASVVFSVPQSTDSIKVFNDVRLIVAERFGEPAADRPGRGLGGGGFGGSGYVSTSEWSLDRSSKEPAGLVLTNESAAVVRLQYRATDRAEREEGRIRAEKAKSL